MLTNVGFDNWGGDYMTLECSSSLSKVAKPSSMSWHSKFLGFGAGSEAMVLVKMIAAIKEYVIDRDSLTSVSAVLAYPFVV